MSTTRFRFVLVIQALINLYLSIVNKIRVPYGLRVLSVLSILRLLNVIFSGFLVGYALKISPQISPLVTSVIPPVQFVSIGISILTVISVLAAIQMRNLLFYLIAAVGYGINILVSLFGLIGVQFSVMLSGFLLTTPSLFILWYWYQMKAYFYDHTFNSDDQWVMTLDRMVNPFLISWAVMVIAVLTFSTLLRLQTGMQVAGESKIYEKAFVGKSFRERNEYCLSQPTEQNRDICLFYGFKFTKNKENITVESCNLIKSEGLRMTCYATIGECSLISEKAMQILCEIGRKK